MRRCKGVLAGLLVVLMAAGATIASAKEEKGKAPDPFEQLGLSKDQRSKLDTLTNERKTIMTANQQKSAEIRKKLVGLLFDKKASDGEIDKAADQVASADREGLLAEIKFHKSMRKILTQEQLTLLGKGGRK